MIKEFFIGMSHSIGQETLKEQTWPAISVDGTAPPPSEFPWWLVGIIGVVVIGVREWKRVKSK